MSERNPGSRGVALRQRLDTHRSGGRCISACRHLRPLSPDEGQRSAHGVGRRRPRHAGDSDRRGARRPPGQVAEEYQAEFLDNWERLGISYDLFTTTHTQNHTEVAQDIFLTLYKNGYIYKDTMSQPYCETNLRFLAEPLCGRNLPTLRLRGLSRRPVRQLRPDS